ncbi:MAG: hypothetical protein IKK45_02185, partial [Akkermansia sp.]|nr:hypothetical protein [Akkermansia sp.]
MSFALERKRDLTLDGTHVTQNEAWKHLEALEGKPLRNARSQFVAVVNKPQRKELANIGKARKSEANGFSMDNHYAAVCRIDKLYEYAIPCGVYPDLKHSDNKVRILRFACPLMIGEEKAIAWMTAKQTTNVEKSERLYNLELVDIEKLAGNLENIESKNLSTLSPAASKDILTQIENAFKTYFEDVPSETFAPNANATASFALEPYTPAELAESFLRRMAAYMRNQARRYRLLYPRMPKDSQAALFSKSVPK